MNLLDWSAIFRAAADCAEARHLDSEERKAALEAAKVEQTAEDVSTVVAHVSEHPGAAVGEIVAALEARGLSRDRAENALAEAKRQGALRVQREGSTHRHFIREGKP